jgi:gliding motility-associated-like protein
MTAQPGRILLAVFIFIFSSFLSFAQGDPLSFARDRQTIERLHDASLSFHYSLNTAPSAPSHARPPIAITTTASPHVRASSGSCRDSSFKKVFESVNRSYSFEISTRTADGGLLLAGFGRDKTQGPPYIFYGTLTKFDSLGNHLWSRELVGDVNSAVTITMVKELSDGSIIASGYYDNNIYTSASLKKDFFITKLTATGSITWFRTFFSQLGTICSNNGIQVKDVAEGVNGDLLFTGFHVNCPNPTYMIVFKTNSSGVVQWKYYYDTPSHDAKGMGIFYNNGEVMVVVRNNNDFIHINFVRLNYATGSLISFKGWRPNPTYAAVFYASFTNVMSVTRLNNGHYCVYGQTLGSYTYTATDTTHFAVTEFDANGDFLHGYSIHAAVLGNYNADKIRVNANGQVTYAITGPTDNYTQDVFFGAVKDGQIMFNRKRTYTGIDAFANLFEAFGDGSYVFIKNMATPSQSNFYLEYSLLHNSDTGSLCLGAKLSFSHIVPLDYIPYSINWTNIQTTPFVETANTGTGSNVLQYIAQDACSQTSTCNYLKLHGASVSCSTQHDFILTATRNASCGAKVEWTLPPAVVQDFTAVDDTTLRVRFSQYWQGWVYGSAATACGAARDSILITVYPSPGAVNLGPDLSICRGNTAVLNAHRGYAAYLWQDGSADSTFTVTQPGTYHVMAQDACGSVFRDTVQVSAAPPIPFDIGPDRIKCNSDTLHLAAPDGFLNYAWGNDYNISSTNLQQVIVNPQTDTFYYAKAEKTPGCFAYDTVYVTVHHSPLINLGADKSFCTGDSAVFDAGGAFQSYLWNNGSVQQVLVTHTAGLYSVTATTAEGCRSMDTVNVLSVFPLPLVNLDKAPGICAGTSKRLDAGSFSSYRWSTGEVTRAITVSNIGSYDVTVTDANGCKASDTAKITTLYPPPAAFLPVDTLICAYEQLTLKSIRIYNRYLWSTGGTQASVTVSRPGIYWLEATDSHDCTGRDSTRVDPKECMKGFYIPSAFTPNRDGHNDRFFPLLFGLVKSYHFTIYNRWGQVVFQTTDPQDGWDGKVKGILQGNAIFVWICNYQFEGEEPKVTKGTVVMIN